MIEKFKVKTPAEGFVRIEAQVREAIKKFGIKEGMAVVFLPAYHRRSNYKRGV